MRLLYLALVTLFCASCASNPKQQPLSSATIKEIKPRYIEEESFKRIREYLTGAEHTGDRVILRSDESDRNGYYFTLVLEENVRRLPVGTRVTAEIHSEKSLDVQTFTFTLPAKRPDTKEIFVGLTGADAPGNRRPPSAWRFTITGPNGTELASAQSYLWSM